MMQHMICNPSETYKSPSETNYPALFLAKSFSQVLKSMFSGWLRAKLVNIKLKTHLSIQYLTMNGSWADYHRGKEFIGNTKTDQIEIITLPLPIRTNIIRLFIQG